MKTNINLDLYSNMSIEVIREAIKKALIDQKISQRKCAIDCGVYYHNFNQYLTGKRATLPLDDIENVLKYLRLTIRPE